MKNFIKNNLIAGLLVVLPVGLTYILLAFVINGLDRSMAPVISDFIIWSGAPLPENFHLPGLGFAVVGIFILLVGLLTTNFFGNKIIEAGDLLMHRTPYVRGIYTTIKQVVTAIAESKKSSFKKLALVKYPHNGMHMLGIVACDTRGEVVHRTGDNQVNVFIPLIPNVTIGFMVVTPRDQITLLEMTLEEGTKFLLSFGIFNEGAEKKSSEPQPTANPPSKTGEA